MTIDWNWFFSAMAQSGAALIAIIAAFVISKLLGEQEKLDNLSSELDRLKISREELVKKLRERRFLWFNERTIIMFSPEINKMFEKIKKIDDPDRKEFLKEQMKEQIRGKIYEIKPDLYPAHDKNMSYLEEKFDSVFPGPGESRSLWERLKEEPLIPGISGVQMRIDLIKEKETVKALRIESEALIDRFKMNKSQLASFPKRIRPIKVTIFSLTIAFIITVVCPLLFLPININSEPLIHFNVNKGIFWGLFILIFGWLFIYFYKLTRGLNKSIKDTLSRHDDDFVKIESYSQYFMPRG